MRDGTRPAALLAGVLALAAACGGDSAEKDIQEIESAYYALRDSILQGDDEAFFGMHCREARDGAIRDFPVIRAKYLAMHPEQREVFHRLFHVTSEEFLGGEPRALVVRIMPWKSGWRERRAIYQRAPVKDVRIEKVALPGGTEERLGVVVLDISSAVVTPDGAPIPENFLPTVVFVKDPEGWRRRYFFSE